MAQKATYTWENLNMRKVFFWKLLLAKDFYWSVSLQHIIWIVTLDAICILRFPMQPVSFEQTRQMCRLFWAFPTRICPTRFLLLQPTYERKKKMQHSIFRVIPTGNNRCCEETCTNLIRELPTVIDIYFLLCTNFTNISKYYITF